MDGARVYYAKQSKSVRERQIPYVFTHMCNLRNKIMDMGGKKERETKKQTLSYREQTNDCQRGSGWGEMSEIGDRD